MTDDANQPDDHQPRRTLSRRSFLQLTAGTGLAAATAACSAPIQDTRTEGEAAPTPGDPAAEPGEEEATAPAGGGYFTPESVQKLREDKFLTLGDVSDITGVPELYVGVSSDHQRDLGESLAIVYNGAEEVAFDNVNGLYSIGDHTFTREELFNARLEAGGNEEYYTAEILAGMRESALTSPAGLLIAGDGRITSNTPGTFGLVAEGAEIDLSGIQPNPRLQYDSQDRRNPADLHDDTKISLAGLIPAQQGGITLKLPNYFGAENVISYGDLHIRPPSYRPFMTSKLWNDPGVQIVNRFNPFGEKVDIGTLAFVSPEGEAVASFDFKNTTPEMLRLEQGQGTRLDEKGRAAEIFVERFRDEKDFSTQLSIPREGEFSQISADLSLEHNLVIDAPAGQETSTDPEQRGIVNGTSNFLLTISPQEGAILNIDFLEHASIGSSPNLIYASEGIPGALIVEHSEYYNRITIIEHALDGLGPTAVIRDGQTFDVTGDSPEERLENWRDAFENYVELNPQIPEGVGHSPGQGWQQRTTVSAPNTARSL